MAAETGIAWTTSTFNPWIGCTKVGPGCDHCYAEARMDSRLHIVNWGPKQPRKRTSVANWRGPVKWNAERARAIAAGENPPPHRVFCSSLADVFDNEVPDEWRAELFKLIEATPHLTWQLLTKRIGNASKMIAHALVAQPDPIQVGAAWPWPNVWIGATVVNQDEADRDIPKLLDVPAAVRFLSIEPMLGAIDIRHFLRYDPIHENQAKRDICVSVRGQRRSGDSTGRDDLEASQAGVGSLAREGSQPPVRPNESGARQRGVLSGSGYAGRDESLRVGTSDGLASLQWGDSRRLDGEPSERDQEGQLAGQSRTRDVSGAAIARDAHSESGPRGGSRWTGQQHGEADHGASSDDQGETFDGRSIEEDRSGLWGGVSDHIEDRARRPALNQIICGGESGKDARPMHPDWPRSLRDQCSAAGVPFFFKQWGEWSPPSCLDDLRKLGDEMRAGKAIHIYGNNREPDGHFRRGDDHLRHVGTKAACNLLDGVQWQQFPDVAA